MTKKQIYRSRSRWQGLFALAFCWLTFGLSAQAQTTGTIQGRVFNPVAKEYVRNAEVRLEGTEQIVYTESDGSFQFTRVPAGQASISIAYTGYTPVTESFIVSAGQTAVREINIRSTSASSSTTDKDSVVYMQAFTVASEREGNSKAVMAQRKDMNIMTSVSSDIFGDVTDGNVGEFLKYLPGVDLDYVEAEARGPRLGGMDSQYVGVAFDGMRSASADALRGGGAAGRATSFEGFSITAIDSIEINRTSSPENDADSPAGTVNMKTKRAFERKGRRFDYNYSANLNGEEFTLRRTAGLRDHPGETSYKWKPNYSLGYSESFFDNRLGLLLSVSHADSYTEQQRTTLDYNRTTQANDSRPLVLRQIDVGDGPKFIDKDAALLTVDWKVTPRLVLSLNLIYSYYEGECWNRNFTFIAANSNANVNNGRSTVGGDGLLTVIAPARTTTANVATVNNGGGNFVKLVYNRQYVPRFEYKIGGLVVDGAFAFSKSLNNYEGLERGLAGSEGGSVTGGWTATRPNEQSWEWVIRQNSGADWNDLRNWVSTDASTGGTRVTNEGRLWITEKWTSNLNARYAIPFLQRFPTTIKIGGKWDEESRDNRTTTAGNTWSYVGPGGNTVVQNPTTKVFQNATFGNWANVGPQFVSGLPFDTGTTNSLSTSSLNGSTAPMPRVSRSALADLFNSHPELFVDTVTPTNFWTANYANTRQIRQTVNAGYAQFDTRATSKLMFRFGVRGEQTKSAFREFDPLTRAQVLAAGYTADAVATNNGRANTIAGLRYQYESQPKVTRRSGYTDWFPSVVGKYQILPNLEWQAGFNKSISRPNLDDLTGLWNTNEANQTVTTANPALLPEYHTVLQTRVAYYFGNQSPGQVSIAFIQDEGRNFTLTRTFTAAEFGVEDPDYAAYTFSSKSNDPAPQKYRNFDFNYTQTLGFLPSPYLKGLGIGLTYSRSYANQPRNQLAPHRATASISYNYRRFNGRIGAIWIDERRIDSLDYRYFGALTKFDISGTFRLNRFASLYVQVRNPTNQKDLYYEGYPGDPKRRVLRLMEEYGDNWVFGVKGQF